MAEQTQTVVEVTGYAARCTCGWEGNWTPLEADAQQHADEHALTHVEDEGVGS